MIFWQKSLVAKLVTSFLLISLVTVGVVSAIAFIQARRTIQQAIFERLNEAMALKTAQINDWVNRQQRDILLLAESKDIRDQAVDLLTKPETSIEFIKAQTSLREFFSSAQLLKPDLAEIFLLSAVGGRVILSTEPSHQGMFHVSSDFFVQGKKGFFVQKVYPSPMTAKPAMTMATPILNPQGKLLGVLAVHLDLSRLEFIVYHRPETKELLGETYLVDRYNVFVSRERFGRDSFPRGVHSRGIDAAIQGMNDCEMYQNYLGVKVIGAYRWLENLDLAIISEIPQDQAFAPAKHLAGNIVLIGLTSAVLLALATFLIARQIARPILAVAQAATHVAQGDLSRQAPVSTQDEVGLLARSFNTMTGQLAKSYTELKDKVEEIETTEKALRKSEEQFRRLVQGSPDGIAVLKNGIIGFINPAGLLMLQYQQPADLHGRPFLDLVVPQSRQCVADYLDHPSLYLRLPSIEIKLICADDQIKEAELTGIPFASAEMDSVQIVIHDISERVRNAEERRRLEDQLLQTQKMEALGVLAGGIAHDFNNLLQAMSGNVQILLRKKDPTDPETEYLHEVERAAHRASDLIHRMLTFSRKMESSLQSLQLNEVIQSSVRLLERTIPKMVALELHLAADLTIIQADPVQMEQVLMNLVTNAVDAMDEHGTLTITTQNCQVQSQDQTLPPEVAPGHYVLLQVSDSGQGMNDSVMRHMFDPFYTTKEVGKGTGLGLSTVYGIIKAHQGHVTCLSRPGQGTTFSIYLPGATCVEPRNRNLSMEPELLQGNGETILMADDEVAILDVAEELLVESGYRVIKARSGEEVLDVYRREGPSVDLVILDLGMPGMGGEKCLEQLKQLNPKVKVVVASGYSSHRIAKKPKDFGAAAFLCKPYRLQGLLLEIRSVLNQDLNSEQI